MLSRTKVGIGVEYVPVEGQRSNVEVSAMKKLSAVMAVALVGALVVVTALSVTNNVRGRSDANRSGLMPEVVSTAEMPRLSMPTVVVHAFRTVAMSTSAGNVN
jgi:hypothetical protein